MSKITVMLDFALNDQVHIDGLWDLTGRVVAISISPGGVSYEVSWWSEREYRTAWFAPGRLSVVAP